MYLSPSSALLRTTPSNEHYRRDISIRSVAKRNDERAAKRYCPQARRDEEGAVPSLARNLLSLGQTLAGLVPGIGFPGSGCSPFSGAICMLRTLESGLIRVGDWFGGLMILTKHANFPLRTT
jgi:hypothetical protein